MLTFIVAVVVAVVPGALLGFSVPASRYRWAAWAASPPLTLGLTAVAMAWMPVLRLPDGALAVLVGELALAAGIVAASRAVRRGWDASTAHSGQPSRGSRLPDRKDLTALVVPVVVALGLGWLFVGGLQRPPGWDAMNHAFLTRRIVDTGTTAMDVACATGSTDAVSACSFYPLSADVTWAQASILSGGRISQAMLAWALAVAPVAMVVGVYAAVRLLRGGRVIASCAAVMSVLLGPMWTSLGSGRGTEQAAPAFAGGVAVLIALSLRGRHPVRTGALAALAGAGIVMSHSYDVLFVGTLALAFAALLHERLRVRSTVLGVSAMTAVSALAIAPVLDLLLGANNERTASPPAYQSGRSSLEFWVLDLDRYALFGFPPPGTRSSLLGVPSIEIALWCAVVGLVASPLCMLLRELRWARPWFLAGVFWTAIGVWTSYSHTPVALALSSTWYGIRERLRTMIMPVYGLIALAGICGLAILVQRLIERAKRSRLRSAVGSPHQVGRAAATTRASVVLTAVLLACGVVPTSWQPLQADLARRAPVGPEYARTFAWLREHTPPGSVVAYDRHLEFMTWSYADYDVGLLFGIPPLDPANVPNYDARWAAFDWLTNARGAKPAGCEVRRLRVAYLAVGERRVPGWPANYARGRLAGSDRVTLIHQDSGLKVYRVTAEGRACP